jgi:hypothetical protein
MTVQELINELQKVKNKNLYIRIHGDGPDGWTYYNHLEWCEEMNVYEEYTFEGEQLDEYRKRFVISGGMF